MFTSHSLIVDCDIASEQRGGAFYYFFPDIHWLFAFIASGKINGSWLCILCCCDMRSCDRFIAIIKNFIFIHKTDFIIVQKFYNITFPLDLLIKDFLMMSRYQFIHTSMFKRDPFHIIVRKKNFMKWGVVV